MKQRQTVLVGKTIGDSTDQMGKIIADRREKDKERIVKKITDTRRYVLSQQQQ